MLGTKSSSFVKFASLVFLSCAISLWSACGGGKKPSTSNGVTVAPAGNSVRVGDTAQFSAIVTGNNNQAVTWSVNPNGGRQRDGWNDRRDWPVSLAGSPPQAEFRDRGGGQRRRQDPERQRFG